jgi:rhodanese-related sulfurtransferase
MKTTLALSFGALLALQPCSRAENTLKNQPPPANPHIDYPGFLEDAAKVSQIRSQRRVTEEQFLEMAADPKTVILDARSADKYALVHVKGAVNLPLPDTAEETLARVIPGKNTRILIYCNNNFGNEREALMTKSARASLNIYTYNTLYSYGYTQIYELAPFVDIHKTKLPLAGSKAAQLRGD